MMYSATGLIKPNNLSYTTQLDSIPPDLLGHFLKHMQRENDYWRKFMYFERLERDAETSHLESQGHKIGTDGRLKPTPYLRSVSYYGAMCPQKGH